MTEEVQKYVQNLSRQKRKLEEEIAIKRRSLEIVISKLSDPDFYLNKELKRGAVKVKRVLGHETVQKQKTVLKKKEVEIEKIETPTVEMELPPAAGAAGQEKKKSSFGFF